MASQSRNPSHRLVEALSALFVVALTSPAAAQSSSSTAAQALFDQARILLEAGQVAEACPKFEESQRLDPGSGTLLNLATCYEKSGRLASAWTTYLEAASASKASGNSEREGVAREQAAALAPRLSFLIVKVGEAARGVRGLQITRDGESVGPAQWDLPVPADSGDHTVVATATGYKSWKASATVKGEGRTRSERSRRGESIAGRRVNSPFRRSMATAQARNHRGGSRRRRTRRRDRIRLQREVDLRGFEVSLQRDERVQRHRPRSS
jgi:hypothetical protein